jgi:hypothetical protein
VARKCRRPDPVPRLVARPTTPASAREAEPQNVAREVSTERFVLLRAVATRQPRTSSSYALRRRSEASLGTKTPPLLGGPDKALRGLSLFNRRLVLEDGRTRPRLDGSGVLVFPRSALHGPPRPSNPALEHKRIECRRTCCRGPGAPCRGRRRNGASVVAIARCSFAAIPAHAGPHRHFTASRRLPLTHACAQRRRQTRRRVRGLYLELS